MNDLKLKDLSERVGISISFLSDIENERSKPSLERLQDIADGLGTTVSYLLGEDGTVNSGKNKNKPDSFENNTNSFFLYEKGDNELLIIRDIDKDVVKLFMDLEYLSGEEKELLKVFLMGLLARREFTET